MPGFDKNRFVIDVPEEFICSICFYVFDYKNTVEDIEGHAFCIECVQTWLKQNRVCPLGDCLLDEKKLKPVGPAFKKLIGSLEVKCKYEKIGCYRSCRMDILESHEVSCTFKNLKCKNCTLTITMDQLNSHRCITSLIDENKQLKKKLHLMEEENFELKAKLNETIKPEELPAVSDIKEIIVQSISYAQKSTLNYAANLRIPFERTEFSIINSDFIVLLCHENDTENDLSRADLLLYDSNLILVKKKTLDQRGRYYYRIALTDDKVYLAYVKQGVVTIDAFNFAFELIHKFKRKVKDVNGIFSIDVCYDKIYLKTKSCIGEYEPTMNTRIFILNTDLTEHCSFKLSFKRIVLDMIIKNDVLISCVDGEFDRVLIMQMKSLTNLTTINTVNLSSSYSRLIIGPGENLFVFEPKERVVHEYNLDGTLIRTFMFEKSDLFEMNAEMEIRITDSYKFVVASLCSHKLFISD